MTKTDLAARPPPLTRPAVSGAPAQPPPVAAEVETRVDPGLARDAARQAALQYGGEAATADLLAAAATQGAALKNAAQALGAALTQLEAGGRPGQILARLKAAQGGVALLPAGADLSSLRGLTARLAGARHPEIRAAATALGVTLAKADAPRVLAELGNSDRVEALIAGTPDPAKVKGMLTTFYPGATALGTTQASLRAELDLDLAQGGIGRELQEILERNGIPAHLSEAVMGMMAEVRAGFRAGTTASELSPADRDMQRTNWVHTRVEVLKAARAFDVGVPRPRSIEGMQARARMMTAALMGSLCSDAFKDATPHSLLWHNRAGAELVLPLLAGRHMDLATPEAQEILQTAKKLAHEHQITPALFMSGAMGGQLAAAKVPEAVAKEITGKLADPLGAPQEGGEIVFSPEARARMEAIGVPGWATMDPKSPHFVASQVVALADVLQYAAPDGLIKIAVDIRDPEQPMPFMRDPNIKAAVGSSVGFSLVKGLEAIVDPAMKAIGEAEGDLMNASLVGKLYPEVERRLAAALGLPEGAALPVVPYWNADVPTDGKLTDAERDSVKLVKATLRDVLAEAGGVPMDPFGANKE
ncbi:MAG: hypothetical protein KC933_06255 [Myxococcales bacterium]|nr:hypothetical protein [Myxococcales bacterium]